MSISSCELGAAFRGIELGEADVFVPGFIRADGVQCSGSGGLR